MTASGKEEGNPANKHGDKLRNITDKIAKVDWGHVFSRMHWSKKIAFERISFLLNTSKLKVIISGSR